MACCHELLGRELGDASVEKQSQALAGFQEKWLDPLMAEKSASEHQAGLDILSLEPRVAFEESLDRIARREHAEDVLHGEATPANDRLATEYFGIDGDSVQESGLVHGDFILPGPVESVALRGFWVYSGEGLDRIARVLNAM